LREVHAAYGRVSTFAARRNIPRFTFPFPWRASCDAAKIFLQNSVLSGIFAVKRQVRQMFRRAAASRCAKALQKAEIG
jgi:hypothetical protein